MGTTGCPGPAPAGWVGICHGLLLHPAPAFHAIHPAADACLPESRLFHRPLRPHCWTLDPTTRRRIRSPATRRAWRNDSQARHSREKHIKFARACGETSKKRGNCRESRLHLGLPPSTVMPGVAARMPKLYGLVSDESQTVVEWFTDLRQAQDMLCAVLADEPAWVGSVRIAEFDLMTPALPLPLTLN